MEKKNAFDYGIRTARSKGLEEKGALIRGAEEEERKIIERINQKAAEDLADIREKIAKDVEDVKASLQQEVDTFVDAIGEKILGRVV